MEASIENCKRLYELSGLGLMRNGTSTESYYNKGFSPASNAFEFKLDHWSNVALQASHLDMKVRKGKAIPAYDTGYLLRMLPPSIRIEFYKRVPNENGVYSWGIEAGDIGGNTWYVEDDDTPEEALCKLVIQLFEDNVLTKEQS